MPVQTEMLGGRLPLLDPQALSAPQKKTYDRLNTTWVAWADSVPFQSKTEDGRFIGPFNPILFSPTEIGVKRPRHPANRRIARDVRCEDALAEGSVRA